jgi:alpha-mannosidase
LIYSGRFENGSFANEKEPSVFGLEWIQKVIISRNLPWIEFQYDVFWQAVNKRIRIAFPSRAQTDKGLYSIPYGALWRDRYEMTEHKLYSPNGDWPALHYVASCPSAEIPGLAVINTGTPSARIENGIVMHSVLRSPGFGHCLFRYAQEYPMPTSEIRDGGFHQFRFGLMPFDGSIPELHRVGSIMNSKTPVFKLRGKNLPISKSFSINQIGVFIESVKPAYDGGIALRVVEMEGKQQEVELTVPDDIGKAAITNMLEKNGQDALIVRGAIRFQIKPYQILTIVLEVK